jgi:hypothetical protein
VEKKAILWKWKKGQVDPLSEHLELRYGDAHTSDHSSWRPLALVGQPENNIFPVTWMLKPQTTEEKNMISAARKSLNFYLVELANQRSFDPWMYACYHCNTSSNMYSQVHRSHFPTGCRGDRVSSVVVRMQGDEGDGLYIVKDDQKIDL